MCLAVPAQLIEIIEDSSINRVGKAKFGSVLRNVNLSLVPHAKVNQYVIVHAGVAINILDEEEALFLIDELNRLYGDEYEIP